MSGDVLTMDHLKALMERLNAEPPTTVWKPVLSHPLLSAAIQQNVVWRNMVLCMQHGEECPS